jgi:hypothetical protein
MNPAAMPQRAVRRAVFFHPHSLPAGVLLEDLQRLGLTGAP